MSNSHPPSGFSGNAADSLHRASSAPPRSTRARNSASTELRQSTILLAHPSDGQGDAVLREAIGEAQVDRLIEQGRYRRDVY